MRSHHSPAPHRVDAAGADHHVPNCAWRTRRRDWRGCGDASDGCGHDDGPHAVRRRPAGTGRARRTDDGYRSSATTNPTTARVSTPTIAPTHTPVRIEDENGVMADVFEEPLERLIHLLCSGFLPIARFNVTVQALPIARVRRGAATIRRCYAFRQLPRLTCGATTNCEPGSPSASVPMHTFTAKIGRTSQNVVR